jgi:hypothetical protein
VSPGDTHRPRVGLLLVHGIGEQAPGEFLGGFRDGFGRLLGVDRAVDVVRHDPVEPSRRIHAAAIELGDRTVMLYEVHWADLITPEMARASFDPIQLFLLAWFPWFNKQSRLPGFDAYSQHHVAGWTARLVPLSVLLFLGYVGLEAVLHPWRAFDAVSVVTDRCRQHRQRQTRLGRATPPSALDTLAAKHELRRLKLWAEGKPRRDRERLEQAVVRTWCDELLDKYAGDVTNFITSMAQLPRLREDFLLARAFGGRAPTDAITSSLPQDRVQAFVEASRREGDVMLLAHRALARFERSAWVAVMQDECTEIQVLAHSLGTLVAYHAMNGSAPTTSTADMPDPHPATLTRLHTIGSPLEKIHFFWPQLVAPRGDRPSLFAEGADGRTVAIKVHQEFEWKNYYSVSDKVSGALTRFRGWRGIDNRRLVGLGGVMSAHVAYGHNASFLGALAEQLGVVVAGQRGGPWRSALAWTWSASQALVLPLILGTVCLLGVALLAAVGAMTAGLFTLLISLVGYLVHWLLTGSVGSFWFGRVFLWSAAFFLVSMTAIISLMVPAWAKRAARVSVARWWRVVRPR